MSTLSIERAKKIVELNSCAAICNPYYLNLDVNSQTYKSLVGQRTSLIEFHKFMFALSDMDLQSLLKKHKRYVTDHYDSMKNDRFLDVAMTRAAVDYQLVLRRGMQHETDLLEEIVKDWRSDLKLAENFNEITSDHLIHFMKALN